MINQLPNKKTLILNSKNNHKHIHKQAIMEGYTYIFTSLEIVFFKKFKKNIFNKPKFNDRLFLFAVDEIHLVN